MTEIKQYSERDAMDLDEVGGYYFRHVLAMTAEGLHSKSEIAAELGWRDMQIAALQEQVRALAAESFNRGSALGEFLKFEKNRADELGGLSEEMEIVRQSAFEAIAALHTDAILREVRAQVLDSLVGVAETMLVKFANQNASNIPEALAWSMVKRHAEDLAARIRAGEKS